MRGGVARGVRREGGMRPVCKRFAAGVLVFWLGGGGGGITVYGVKEGDGGWNGMVPGLWGVEWRSDGRVFG